jgi:hypothetical protein
MDKLLDFALNIDTLWGSINKEDITKQILDDIHKSEFNIALNIDHIPKQFGLYVFFIKPKEDYKYIEMIEKDWIDKEFSNYPKIIKKRFEANTKIEDWTPFYLGKSEKVGKRIWEHLNHHKNHATYGLKLNERNDFKSKNEIKVGFWLLPVDEKIPNEIKQFIITNFESKIREKLNPWIGKQ